MNTEIVELCNRAASAIFDGGCRGALIVAAVWVLLKIVRRTNAATRHAVWFATLLIVAALPIVIFCQSQQPEIISGQATPIEVEPLLEAPSTETSTSWNLRISVPHLTSAILIFTWLFLAFVRIILLASQLSALGTITRRALAAPADLKELCGNISRRMELRRRVRLLITSETSSPMVVGLFNARVLVPTHLAAEPHIESILRHEFAHVARWDDWTNLIQQSIKAIFFFHPGVLIASRRLTAEREIACDDHALAALSAPREYALFLTEFAGRMRGRDYAAAPAAWSSRSQLKERIDMILDEKRNASPRLDRARFGTITAASIAMAALAFSIGPRLAIAGESENAVDKTIETSTSIEASVEVAPRITVHPAPVAAPAPAVSVTVPAVASVPLPPSVDIVGPRAVRIAGPARIREDNENLERRLDRLERMVANLMGRDKEKPKGQFGFMEPMPKGQGPDDLKMKFKMDEQEKARIKDMAKREADRARREADRAMKVGEESRKSALKDNEWARERAEWKAERGGAEDRQQNLERERQSLELQRRSIEKRIESIEKEIQKRGQENKNSNRDLNRDTGPKEKEKF